MYSISNILWGERHDTTQDNKCTQMNACSPNADGLTCGIAVWLKCITSVRGGSVWVALDKWNPELPACGWHAEEAKFSLSLLGWDASRRTPTWSSTGAASSTCRTVTWRVPNFYKNQNLFWNNPRIYLTKSFRNTPKSQSTESKYSPLSMPLDLPFSSLDLKRAGGGRGRARRGSTGAGRDPPWGHFHDFLLSWFWIVPILFFVIDEQVQYR